ncbi:uncharacterized protein ASPGLDRAFT_883742 [Aspergillus glaucus CBS 516.65]|uniref:HNH nuclease domain-containing protein n=1 Tax=Aspergillus glaucus CBS 516.65 TaxID=1160497 RepID=A0A1L9V8K5_ASPGL|nr:hypothetical protein ASPGLDRAFT_883742 [Aspergillus glaucus CBS 516.65]OJJ80205.1 hypothetical protein ASPGLDRAFT_883742 [Aspergillus glaucus CBS 516.65]
MSFHRYVLFDACLVKATSGKTPKISPVGSDDDGPDPARADLSKLRGDVLLRDNNRCIISGHYDVYQIPRKEREGLLTTYTSCSHIFPYLSGPSTLNGILTDGELSRVSRFWAFVYRYFPNIKGVLDMNKPGEINARRNTMTDDSILYTAFASFQLTLEPLGGHTYDIRTFDGFPNPLQQMVA